MNWCKAAQTTPLYTGRPLVKLQIAVANTVCTAYQAAATTNIG